MFIVPVGAVSSQTMTKGMMMTMPSRITGGVHTHLEIHVAAALDAKQAQPFATRSALRTAPDIGTMVSR